MNICVRAFTVLYVQFIIRYWFSKKKAERKRERTSFDVLSVLFDPRGNREADEDGDGRHEHVAHFAHVHVLQVAQADRED